MAEPRILTFRQLTCADEDLITIVSLAVADGERGGFRPDGIALVKSSLFVFQPGHKHIVKPVCDALSHNGAVDPDHRIFRRR